VTDHAVNDDKFDVVFRDHGEKSVNQQALVAAVVGSCDKYVVGDGLGIQPVCLSDLVDSFRHEGAFSIDEGNVSF